MTIGNEPVQPGPTDQPAPVVVDANAPAAPAAADPIAEAAARMMADPDLIELEAAKAALKVEESANSAANGNNPAEGTTQPAPTPAAAAPTPDPKAQQQQQPPAKPMIPKERFDEVNDRRQKAENHAAFLQGQLSALKTAPAAAAAAAPQAPQPTPQERLAAVHSAQDALAAKYDNGEITMAEMTRQKRALDNDEATIREDVLLSKVPKPAATQPAQTNDLYLDQLTAKIEVDHPMVMAFDKHGTDRDWNYVKGIAIDNLVARGIDPTKGDLGKYHLRKEMAVVIDEVAPVLIGKRAQAAGEQLPTGQLPSQGQQQQQKPANGSATARAAKLDLAASAPPNLSQTRSSGDDPAAPTDSRIETMSDDEIAALPAATRNKLLGHSA